MHELPVTESLLEIAIRHAQAANAARITDLYLVIGELASIVDDSVQFYWEIIAKETIAEGATLHFRRIPTEMHCLSCGHRYNPGEARFSCPVCDSTQVKIVSGQEFFLESIGVESNNEAN